MTVANGFSEDGTFPTSSSNFVESAPFGNPPGDHDVAARFEVLSDQDVTLEYLDIGVTVSVNASGPLEVYLVGEGPTSNQNLSSEPDMGNVLEQWEVSRTELVVQGSRMVSAVGPQLKAHNQYWIVLSVTEPTSRYQWWTGIASDMPGGAHAERYDFQVSALPPGAWIGTDRLQPSASIRVVGSLG